MIDYSKANFNHYVNELNVLYFDHFSIVTEYVKRIEDDIWYIQHRGTQVDVFRHNLSYQVYEWIASISCTELDAMYAKADKWFKYLSYRKRYETKEWWTKRYERGLSKRFSKDIVGNVIGFLI